MSVTTHTYTAVVKRPGGRDAVLALKGGRIELNGSRSPHVTATLDVAVPSGWAPLKPREHGHWEPTGAPQLPFFSDDGAPPFYISAAAERWVAEDSTWTTDPLGDDDPVEIIDPDPLPFFGEGGGPPFYISPSKIIVIPPPRPAELRDLDPRDAPRIVLTAKRVDSFGVKQTRVFDLTLRDRTIGQADGTIGLELTSDEGLVEDFAPIDGDDISPLSEPTLEAVVLHVLRAVLGDDVELNAPMTTAIVAAWSARNMLPNPTMRLTVDGWSSTGGGAPAWSGALGANGEVGYLQVTHTGPVGRLVASDGEPWQVAATPGRRYAFRIDVRSPHSMSLRVGTQFRNEAGAVIATSTPSAFMPASADWAPHIHVSEKAPRGTTHVTPFVEWAGSGAGRVLHADCALLDESEFVPPYFDGSTVDTSMYSYEWEDGAHASPSTRTLLVDATPPDALVWRAGDGGMRFLSPLVQAAGFRLVCTEDRKWHLRSTEWEAAGKISIAYAVNMIAGTDSISRDGDWCNAAVVRYRWRANGEQLEHVEYFAIDRAQPRVRTIDVDTPYPGPGLAEYAVRRAQGRGREVTAAAVADWTARADMPVTVVLNGAVPQTGLIRSVSFDLTRDEMSITTRTIDDGSTA